MKRLMFLALLSASACRIEPGEVPAFGGPCSGAACPDGFVCDAALLACVPGDPIAGEGEGEGEGEPPTRAIIEEFSVNVADVRPGADLVFTVSTIDAASCSIDNGIGAVAVNGTEDAIAPVTPGNTLYTLTCRGTDDVDVDAALPAPGVHVRRVEPALSIGSNEDVDAFDDVEEVDGDVTITGGVTSTSALALRIVHGDVSVAGLTTAPTIALPSLALVDGSFSVVVTDPNSPSTLDLPALLFVGGNFQVRKDFVLQTVPLLSTVRAPLLVDVGGDFRVSYFDYDIDGDGNPDDGVGQDGSLAGLSTLEVANLETVGGNFQLESATALTTLALPALASIGGVLVLFGSSLTTFELPALDRVGGGMIVERNEALARVRLTALTDVGGDATIPARAYDISYDQFIGDTFFTPGDARFVATGASAASNNDPFDNLSIIELQLPLLESVEARLILVGMDLPAIDLGSLVSAGGLEIDCAFTPCDVDLANLQTVGAQGFVTLSRVGTMGALTSVEGNFSHNSFVDDVPRFPLLANVGGRLDLHLLSSAQIVAQTFPALTTVGTLSLEDTNGLTSLAALPPTWSAATVRIIGSSLTSLALPHSPATSLLVQNNASLATIALNGTEPVGNVVATGNAQLDTIDFGAVAVAGNITINAPDLDGLAACALAAAGNITITATDLVDLHGLAALTSAGTLSVTNNATLPPCYVTTLATDAGATSTTNTGNGGADPGDCSLVDAQCALP